MFFTVLFKIKRNLEKYNQKYGIYLIYFYIIQTINFKDNDVDEYLKWKYIILNMV